MRAYVLSVFNPGVVQPAELQITVDDLLGGCHGNLGRFSFDRRLGNSSRRGCGRRSCAAGVLASFPHRRDYDLTGARDAVARIGDAQALHQLALEEAVREVVAAPHGAQRPLASIVQEALAIMETGSPRAEPGQAPSERSVALHRGSAHRLLCVGRVDQELVGQWLGFVAHRISSDCWVICSRRDSNVAGVSPFVISPGGRDFVRKFAKS